MLIQTVIPTKSLHKPQSGWLVVAVCDVETMCFHNLPKPMAVDKTPKSIFFSPICTWPSSKHMQIHCSLNLFSAVHSEICNRYTDSGRQTTSGMNAELKAAGKKDIFPADKLCNRQTMVSRPEESNLKGISACMSAEQVDHDVT